MERVFCQGVDEKEKGCGYGAGQIIYDIVADNLHVNEGDRAILPCFYSPTDAVIGKWYWKTNESVIIRSGDPPDPNSRYSLGDATSGNVSLVIKNILRWDKGTYTCGVNDQSRESTDDCKLIVNYLDNPTITALSDENIIKNTKVSMLCKTYSSSELDMITWFHEGNIIDRDSSKYIFKDEINVLMINAFDQSYEGNYSCRVENKFFAGKNGKYSNSVVFSLLTEASPPPSSSSKIWMVFIIIPIFILGAVVYFLKKRPKNKHRFDDIINNMLIKKDQKNEINAERALDDFKTMAYLKRDFAKSEYEEALDFEHDKEITVARGECIEASFKSNYKSNHVCFKKMPGDNYPFCTILLLSRAWPENILRRLYPPHKKLKDKIKGNCNVNDSHGPVEFTFELKGLIENGAAGDGYLTFKDVTDDVEGQYVYLLQIKHEKRQSGALPYIKHTFFGKTCIQLSSKSA
ncbi:uncharacterized protein LOC117112581 [Anneissia japonica]|uniref:uncharacterized protein LOC117112581 n=1 Tax=Anneissia japonica TaxID=1529436 RepID=UPI0014256405|nr:uncharacterized protein LOC117112581 [Anneissia japonica]